MSTLSRGTILEPSYVTGFLEASGAFTFSRNGRGFVPQLTVKRDDPELLQEIQEFFGGGTLYDGGRHLRVCRIEELVGVVEHFERHPLRGEKAKTFEIWAQIVRLKASSFRKPAFAKLDALAARLVSRHG